ncbi:hypothetical protein A2926_03385 [Candidatus Giovannonibacteria bacterium RIFCSPLOWO2_01_FULL_44_40]|uniref:Transcriptional repressor PaaX-like central Cas2-like domain-containing protein n=1 Tax=Candidatus Giovannonibacteria bacterium RIFCSPHIGHO2_01_FULL_45_23 TaxID=1798325 RepID=A0A1F5VF64_9BACT|nr:MAG: hypothetical protein A2834_02095 [Candidatus Giovannonibacteria bacterium RIFCSPHIGHO2_01_FULL_45_23]OGF75093.1 MAG: hypothetical protein A3C77_04200 [Candidatus Giovannonibacteria bacterium RIFCSPHIGHO2_02_FULL_45_13]OGF80206.1 MAG: hypothetical protein A2926_03385 [Candidatus Giovannonibacteria bacterium RIFCSPLOWO2_01_FULL_44_40]
MPRHKPILFKEPTGLQANIKKRIETYVKRHPVAVSAAKVVLALAAVGGILTLATAVPGLMGGLNKARISEKRDKRERYNRLWQNFYRLKKERALEYVGEKDGALLYKLTEQGRTKLRGFLLETLEVSTPIKWDGYWRVVVFDIPEKQKSARRAIQRKMAELGFYPLQKSVWVHPFYCEVEIEFLKELFEVKPHVHILLVPQMPDGKALYFFRNQLKEVI